MWAYAQQTAKHRAKFGWLPLSDGAAVTKPRRETRWNLLGCPKPANRSQPLVGESLPYCKDIWRRYCCLTNIFPIIDTGLNCEDIAQQICAIARRWRFLDDFLRPVFLASLVHHTLDLHGKFSLRPHHVWKYGRHPICDRWEQASKKERKKERNHIGRKYNGLPYWAAIIKVHSRISYWNGVELFYLLIL